jgi:hypothetical protein
MNFQRDVAIGSVFLFALTGPALEALKARQKRMSENVATASISAQDHDFDLPHNHFEIRDPGPSTAAEIVVSGAQINGAASIPTESLKQVVASVGIPWENERKIGG